MAEAIVDWRIDAADGQLRPYVVTGKGRPIMATWAPQEGSQRAFLECQAFECLYEGARGPGKTDTLIMDFAQHVGPDRRKDKSQPQWSGWGAEWRGILFRQTFPQLSDVIVKTKKWFPLLFPEAKYNESTHTWVWPTGETLRFAYGAREADYWNYHGHSWPWMAFEELTTWSDPGFFLKMQSCCRSTVKGIPKKLRATTNPYGCVPFGDVLTTRGWVRIQDVRKGDTVVSVRQNGTACETVVAAVISQQYCGTMIHRHGAGLDMVFTEDHRLPLPDGRIRHFYDLPGQANIRRTAKGWEGQPLLSFSPPVIKTKRKPISPVPDSISGSDFAELLGWLISEGSARFGSSQFQIAQMKSENKDRIRVLLDRCGFTYSETFNQFQIYGKRWAQWVASLGPRSWLKMLPKWFLRCETKILRQFFDAAMLGDGCGGVYYTLSRVLADQMAEIAIKLGYSVRVTSGTRDGRAHRGYAVCCTHRDVIQLVTGNHKYNVKTTCKSVNIQREQFTGQVYCLSVPETETFFIRQNGCVWLSGNSGHNWVKARYHLPLPPGRIEGPLIREKDQEGKPVPERMAIHGFLDENKILLTADPEYKSRIRAAARNKAELAAWMDGSWDIVAGGMFDDVWDAKRHVVPVFDIPHSWRIDRSFDWGSSRPFSVGWWAESDGSDIRLRDGRVCSTVRGDLFRIGEWYGWTGQPNEGKRMLATDIAKGIIERELALGIHGRCKAGPADAAVFKTENGVCIANDLMTPVIVNGEKHQIRFVSSNSAPGTRKIGWELMRRRFLAAAPQEGHRGPREFPGLFVFERCEQFRRTVPVLPRDDKDLDDVDSDTEDHIADESRYRVMFSQWRPKGGTVVGVAG